MADEKDKQNQDDSGILPDLEGDGYDVLNAEDIAEGVAAGMLTAHAAKIPTADDVALAIMTGLIYRGVEPGQAGAQAWANGVLAYFDGRDMFLKIHGPKDAAPQS